MNPQELIHVGEGFLRGLFQRMNLAIQVKGDADQRGGYVFELRGDVITLKRRADVMSALGTLLGQALSQAAGERVRSALDLEGRYLLREALLETVALDVAANVKITGRRGVLAGLNPAERRLVHGVISEDKEIATHSEGQPESRILFIEPA
ncbi:hypothetical protein KKF91_13255 [Myxococcota bacterium]|nr:hypothetical protein [Myxococcota bacterium]MBU1431504.1 hypothetical protein [Myxococcota bacterium]MBU1898157.1 hypothetical protein [Myxococcota bacterium]